MESSGASAGASTLPKCSPQRVAVWRNACSLLAPTRRSRSTLSMLTPRPAIAEAGSAFRGPAHQKILTRSREARVQSGEALAVPSPHEAAGEPQPARRILHVAVA